MQSGTGGIVDRRDVGSISVPLYVQNGNNSVTNRSQRFEELIVPICMHSGASSGPVVSQILSDRGCRGATDVDVGGTLTFFSMSKEELLVPLTARACDAGIWAPARLRLAHMAERRPSSLFCRANFLKKQCATSAVAPIFASTQAVH